MPFIKGKVALREISATRWELLEPIEYRGRNQIFYVHDGFTTDLASVPRLLTWLVPRYGVYTKAAIVHDFLCETKPINRADADGMFRRMMRELDVPILLRWLMWAAVRAGSNLVDATFKDKVIWLVITVPAVIFLLIPGVTVWIYLLIFWILEWLFYILLKPFSKKRVNKPRISLRRR